MHNSALHRHEQGDSSWCPREHHCGLASKLTQQTDASELAQSQCSIVHILALGAIYSLKLPPPHLAGAAAAPQAAISLYLLQPLQHRNQLPVLPQVPVFPHLRGCLAWGEPHKTVTLRQHHSITIN